MATKKVEIQPMESIEHWLKEHFPYYLIWEIFDPPPIDFFKSLNKEQWIRFHQLEIDLKIKSWELKKEFLKSMEGI